MIATKEGLPNCHKVQDFCYFALVARQVCSKFHDFDEVQLFRIVDQALNSTGEPSAQVREQLGHASWLCGVEASPAF